MQTMAKAKPPVVTHIISGDLWAGAEAQVYQLISGLKAADQIVPTAVVFNKGILYNKLAGLGINVTLADETSMSPLAQVLSIRAHLREYHTNIVHTHGFKENVLGTIAQHLARVPRSLRTAHGNPEIATTWRKPLKKLTSLLDDATAHYGQDAVVAVSRQLEATLSARYPNKTVRISNFIELPETNTQFERPDLHSNRSYSIALVGRAVPVKRLDIFIDTIAQLRDQYGLDVNGAIYGDGPLLSSMKAYSSGKVGDAIEFKGFVSNINDELIKADVLMMPSDHEGLPMSLLEALAMGVPVVAHAVGGIPEVLNNGKCGTLVQEHSPNGYAAAIAHLLKNDQVMAQFRDAGKMHVSKEFSAATNIEKYQSLYADLHGHETLNNLKSANRTS